MRYLWILLLLAGCVTPEQRAMQVIAEFGPYCEKLGYKRDTDAWRQCLQAEDANAAAASYRAFEGMRMRYGPCYRDSVFC